MQQQQRVTSYESKNKAQNTTAILTMMMMIIIIMIINIIREERTRSYLRNNQYKKMKEHNCHYFNQANKTKPSQAKKKTTRNAPKNLNERNVITCIIIISSGRDWIGWNELEGVTYKRSDMNIV